MNCQHCGAEVTGDTCTYCGQKIEIPNQGSSSNTPHINYNYGYSPYPQPSYPQKEKWYQKTWVSILFLIFIWPVGLFLMWKYKKNWNKIVKIIVTVLVALCVVYFYTRKDADNDAYPSSTIESTTKTTTVQEDSVDNEDTTDITEPAKPEVETWSDGMYKAGADIQAGEYVLFAGWSGYFEIASDSSGTLESIIANDNFSTNSIITIADGQYLTLNDCEAYRIDEAPSLDPTKEGMFKVGKDIAAGEYKIHADSSGYVEVSSSSNHVIDSIISNDNFTGDRYITVSDGQYLKLTRAYIMQ